MRKTNIAYPLIAVLLGISLLFFFLSRQGLFNAVPLVNTMFSPLQKALVTTTQQFSSSSESQLKKENTDVIKQLSDYKKLQQDNAALRDQFQSTKIPSGHLLPSHVVGAPGLIGGSVEYLILDKGSSDGVKEGMVVVYKNMLVGTIVKTTGGYSQMDVVSNADISFSAKTLQTHALGVVKGQGGGSILLDNVVLDQTLKKNDVVVTSGDLDIHGKGYPPDLIVGKIVSIQKDPSALFQKAVIASPINLSTLSMVFIKIN